MISCLCSNSTNLFQLDTAVILILASQMLADPSPVTLARHSHQIPSYSDRVVQRGLRAFGRLACCRNLVFVFVSMRENNFEIQHKNCHIMK